LVATTISIACLVTLDINRDMVVMDQVSQYKCLFNRFDENGDGKISPAELRQCMEAIGENALAKFAEKVVDILDTDQDGLLGFDSFVMLLESRKFKDDKVLIELQKSFKMYEKYDFVLSDPKVSHLRLLLSSVFIV
jgi:Ca2+-binding EF-hand superfamily protein